MVIFAKIFGMKKLLAFLGIVIVFLSPKPTQAWGLIGHRIVGQIADSYLTVKAKKEIKAILGFESVAIASNWADFIKSDSNYRSYNPWHYVNFLPNISQQEFEAALAADTGVNAYVKSKFLISELKQNRLMPTETKRMYLRLLIHIIGDVHQPFHLGRKDDNGGNSIKVKWFGDNSNLHAVWDEKLIEYQQLSYTEYAAAINNVTLAQRLQWQKQTFEQWLFDTYQLTNKVYAAAKPDENLRFEYNFKFVADMNDQLLKGGIHLAAVLNDIYK
jgi:hypothetical protein